MAASTDKLLKTGAATKTTLASPGKAVGAASININSAVNWPTDTAVVFAIRSIELVDGEYQEVSGTYAEFIGVVSGTTINSLSLVYGTDQVYTSGSTTEVFIPISSYAHNRMIDALLVEHDQDGTHGNVTTANLTVAGTLTLPAGSVETADYADNSVTPAKRTGGFFIGSVPASTFSSTGVKSITGVGFTPKLVRFTIMPTANTAVSVAGSGGMTSASQFWTFTSSLTGNWARESGTTACIVARSPGTNTPLFTAVYSAMGADGFSINVTTASGSAWDVAYEAYA